MNSPNILVLTYSTPDTFYYANLSAKINESYCKKHNFDFIKESYEVTNWYPSYERLNLIKKYLDKYDYIMWIDSDACFINFEKKLTELIIDDKDFYIGGNIYGFDMDGNKIKPIINNLPAGINAGVFIIKNSEWSKKFLDLWIHQCINYLDCVHREQGILQKLLCDNILDIQNHIKLIVPAYEINREDTDLKLEEKWDRCDFILHLWGSTPKYRFEVFSEIIIGKRPRLHENFELPYFNVSV